MRTLAFDLIRVLEVIFVVGAAGSLLVVVLTTIEDIKMLFSKSEGADH